MLMVAFHSSASDRNNKINELMEALGYLDTWAQQLEMGRQYNEQLGKDMLNKVLLGQNLTDEYKEKLQLAFNRYMEGATSFQSAEDMVELWAKIYGPNFTDEELDQLIQFYTSPLGSKDVRVTQDTTVAFSKELQVKGKIAIDSAIQELVEELQFIIRECSCPK